jgi:hypothetical protein
MGNFTALAYASLDTTDLQARFYCHFDRMLRYNIY